MAGRIDSGPFDQAAESRRRIAGLHGRVQAELKGTGSSFPCRGKGRTRVARRAASAFRAAGGGVESAPCHTAEAAHACPADPHRLTDATQPLSAASDGGESTPDAPPAATPAQPRFGPPAEPGEVGTLGPYRVLKVLGRGGMGAVYAALDTRLGRRLALKVMLPEFAAVRAAKDRFIREARIAAGITHDNVVTIYEGDERQGVTYIAMQYLEGSGRLPFQRPTTMAVLMALGTEEPPPVRGQNPAVPEPLAALIHELLAKTAAARPTSADEVVRRVRAIEQGVDIPFAGAGEGVSQPQVVYVPIQVTVVSEANPFADLDATVVEPVPDGRHPAPAWAAAGGAWRLAAAGLVAVLALVVVVVVAVNRGRDRDEPKAETADATPPPRAREGKTPAAAPAARPPATDDPQWKAADGVVLSGGGVRVNGNEDGDEIRTAAGLPKDRFTVTVVNLDNTEVTDAGLARLKDCAGLTHLYLNNTKVTDAGLAHLKGCTALRHLGLAGTPVTGAGFAHLRESPGLATIDLNGARAADAGLAGLKGFTQLASLHLVGTPVTDAGLASLKGCTALATLDLSNTAVTDAGLMHLKTCAGLKSLGLSGTAVTGPGLAHLKGCPVLKGLNLYGAKVTDAGLAHLKDCRNLENLDLNSAPVTDAGLANLKGRTKLVYLQLANSRVTDAGLADLKDCAGLQTLRLRGTKVTDGGLTYLKGCAKLEDLDVRMTGVTAKGVGALHAVVPGCRIEYDGGVIEPKK